MKTSGRSKRYMEKLGFTTGVVERRLPHTKLTSDFLGIIDIIACKDGMPGAIGIQACAAGEMAAHRVKALNEPRLRVWLTGNRFELHGWEKKGHRWIVKREALLVGRAWNGIASIVIRNERPEEVPHDFLGLSQGDDRISETPYFEG